MCRHIWIFSAYKVCNGIYKAVCSRCKSVSDRKITPGISHNHGLFLELIGKDHQGFNLPVEIIEPEEIRHMRHWKRVRKFIIEHTDNSGL